MTATIDGKAVPYWQPVTVPAGAVLSLGAIQGAGQRTYLAVKGGFVVPQYLGSKATFTLRPVRRSRRVARCARAMCCGYRIPRSCAGSCSPTKRRMSARRPPLR